MKFANFTLEQYRLVQQIIRRANDIAAPASLDPLTVSMDLAAVHHHTPLDLAALAAADDANLAHDVFGIARHIDRETGELRDCFHPRYAAFPTGDDNSGFDNGSE